MIPTIANRLGEIIEQAKERGDPMGYFPALYRRVTVELGTRIEHGHFDDGPRMERLVEVFAGRYLDAVDGQAAGRSVTASWQLAFDAGRDWWPIVLQHLLLGMNAHINLDLGIAVAEVGRGSRLADIRDDFVRINAVLAGLVDQVQEELADIWPLFRILDYTAARKDEAVVNFAMSVARERAWQVAEQLSAMAEAEREPFARAVDRETVAVGKAVRDPGLWVGTVLRLVRLGERGSTREKIEIIGGGLT